MIYQGKAFHISCPEDGIIECCFDLQGESVNKFNNLALNELAEVIPIIQNNATEGVIFTSNKESFIVGADITEFSDLFSQDPIELLQKIMTINFLLSTIEDLDIPTVTAINGVALGGGFEYALSTDYRIITPKAKIGLPEVKLGIFPGWGGTVRLSRLIGADNAIEWICSGKEYTANIALKTGAVDAIIEPNNLLQAAIKMLRECHHGMNYKARKQLKKNKLMLSNMEAMLTFESAKAVVAQKAGKHYPAPVSAIKTIQKHAFLERDKALEIEAKAFIKLAQSHTCNSLIQVFLNSQFLKKQSKKTTSKPKNICKVAVLGAGIMGGGIAYQSASKDIPTLIKDVNQDSLNTGISEVGNLFNKAISLKKLTPHAMIEKLTHINPTLSYGDFHTVDLVIEAVVENIDIKKQVLSEVSQHVTEGTIITSNTSTITIDLLASSVKTSENFCGMHFFNPVHKMPLVEIIRGKNTSQNTITTAVQYVKNIGKTPVVVNDCPGFLVNRVLFPYLYAFCRILQDGADFQQVDTIVEKFGWPMGPAYLFDVIGLDTIMHASQVMAQGYPDRMQQNGTTAIDVLYENNRLGQKNGAGFYSYPQDKRGKPVKTPDPNVYTLLEKISYSSKKITEEEIIQRLMIPMCMETVRALEEGIVNSPQEADIALIMGVGFPPYLCGPLKYIDAMGVETFIKLADSYGDISATYHPTTELKQMAKKQQTFYKS